MASAIFELTYWSQDRKPEDDEVQQTWREMKRYRHWAATRFHIAMDGADSIEERRRLQQLMKELTGFSVGIQEGNNDD